LETRGLEREVSSFDAISLLVIDHDKGESVTMTGDGRGVTVRPGEKISLTLHPDRVPDRRVRDIVLVTRGYFTREMKFKAQAQLDLPTHDRLDAVTPNPFARSTTIRYAVAPPAHRITIVVFDANGRRVKTIFRGTKPAGRYATKWDSRTEKGENAPAGMYFCRMATRGQTDVLKVMKLQ